MARTRIGVYPGTFDPIHNGHLDIIRRATHLVDRLVVAVAINAGKEPLFTLPERARMVEGELARLSRAEGTNGAVVEVRPFATLLMHFAAANRAELVVRGLRAVSDFEYEFQMAANNKRIYPSIETVFLMASETSQFISSRFVKEIHALEGALSSFVTPPVLAELDGKRGRSAPPPG